MFVSCQAGAKKFGTKTATCVQCMEDWKPPKPSCPDRNGRFIRWSTLILFIHQIGEWVILHPDEFGNKASCGKNCTLSMPMHSGFLKDWKHEFIGLLESNNWWALRTVDATQFCCCQSRASLSVKLTDSSVE